MNTNYDGKSAVLFEGASEVLELSAEPLHSRHEYDKVAQD